MLRTPERAGSCGDQARYLLDVSSRTACRARSTLPLSRGALVRDVFPGHFTALRHGRCRHAPLRPGVRHPLRCRRDRAGCRPRPGQLRTVVRGSMMPAFTEYFCGLCNPSCQRRDPGDEVHTGYIRKQADGELPRGWFEIKANGGDCACGKCPQSRRLLLVARDEEAHPALAAVAGLAGSAPGTSVRVESVTATNTEGSEARWPSRTSPFGVAPRTTGVDTPADQDVHEDGQ